MTPKEYSASEAKRLLEELAPYFAALEKQVVEEMITTCSWDENSDRKRRCLADEITTIRNVQGKLRTVIAGGALKRAVGIA